jgi:exodeoxyribonuclease VII large subunit
MYSSTPTSTDTALSVAGLTEYIQTLLEEDTQLRQVWVTGEVSSAHGHAKGTFFTLSDPQGNAAIRCVVWRSHQDKLVTRPNTGEQILVLGSIRLYPTRGEYQLTVWQALPAGEGLQALRYRQLHDRLQAEGLFDLSRKRSLPPHPQTIAVVTSPQAAAWGDIQRTLVQRYPGLCVLLSPAIVQGDSAPESIAAAVDRVGRDGRAEVLILARGGGAVEDLACFNDERVIRAIATSPIPVITGIGHQRDESLADLVADACAHTPTASAELAVPALAQLSNAHRDRITQLQTTLDHRLHLEHLHLQQLQQRLQMLSPDRLLQQESARLNLLRQQLVQVTRSRWQQERWRTQLAREKLASLDPTAVLRRGYAVARTESGTIVRSTADLAGEERLQLQLADGTAIVQIVAIETQRD